MPRRALLLVALLCCPPLSVQASDTKPVTSIDLRQAFATRSDWRFTATQAPDLPDRIAGDGTVPGAIRLCLSADDGRTCRPQLNGLLLPASGPDPYSEVHQLDQARIVTADGVPLLLLTVSSLHGMNGDRRTVTAALSYDRGSDRFVQSYLKLYGHNNDQEVRFVQTGPLAGALISAEPTQDAPFAFWVEVDRMRDGAFRRVLRYRSATRYGDGNPLPVIDAEMPEIQRRLGLWHAGMTLPLPAGSCRDPHLRRGGALWCQPAGGR